jgi:hypothetical protein
MSDITVNGNTVDTGAALLKLDALVSAYSAILEQATQQLETLELSDQQLNRVSDRMARHIDYYNLANSLTNTFRNESAPETESFTNQLVYRITSNIDEHHLKPIVDRLVSKQLAELQQSVFQSLFNRMNVEIRDRIEQMERNDRTANRQLGAAVSHILGDEIRSLIAESLTPWTSSTESLMDTISDLKAQRCDSNDETARTA